VTTPDTPSVREELASLAGRSVFFDPLWGNHGDTLIELGARELLARADIRLVKDPRRANAIIVNGSGGMIDLRGAALRRLERYCADYPETSIIVLPSSFLFTTTDFSAFFEGRTAEAVLFAREQASLEIISGIQYPTTVRIGMDDDLAFSLADTPLMRKLEQRVTNEHILIVERADQEGVTPTTPANPANQSTPNPTLLRRIRNAIPQPVRTAAARRVRGRSLRPRQPASDFEKKAYTIASQEVGDMPAVIADISRQDLCSFNRFLDLIARSAFVVTTRMHVGILAAMLGKPTVMQPGSYHKIRGVYEQSLNRFDNARLVDLADREPG